MKFNCAFWHFDGNNAPGIKQMNIYDSNIGCQLWISSGKLKKNHMNLFYFFESGGINGYTVYKWTTDLMIVIGNFGKFVHATTGMIIRTCEYEKLQDVCYFHVPVRVS